MAGTVSDDEDDQLGQLRRLLHEDHARHGYRVGQWAGGYLLGMLDAGVPQEKAVGMVHVLAINLCDRATGEED